MKTKKIIKYLVVLMCVFSLTGCVKYAKNGKKTYSNEKTGQRIVSNIIYYSFYHLVFVLIIAEESLLFLSLKFVKYINLSNLSLVLLLLSLYKFTELLLR